MLSNSISAIIITHNEEQNIEECLRSLKFCDEIVLVDYRSSDNTVDIAKKFHIDTTVTDDWPGFGIQKQRALDRATCDWILSIDADERITPALRDEILKAISDSTTDGYFIDRRSYFLGKEMRFGGWSPDYVLRLARREKARFTYTPVHEELIITGLSKRLSEPMLHYSYRKIDDVLIKQTRYALASAYKSDEKCHYCLSKAILHSAWTFFRHYLWKLGLLDGKHGLIAAVSKSQETFWKYAARCFIN